VGLYADISRPIIIGVRIRVSQRRRNEHNPASTEGRFSVRNLLDFSSSSNQQAISFIAHCNALQGPCVYPIRLQHRWQRYDLDRAKKTEECMRFREMTTLLSVGIP